MSQATLRCIGPFMTLVFFVATSGRAQYVPGRYEVGLSVGALVYTGDLTPNPVGSVQLAQPVVGLQVTKLLGATTGLRAEVAYGSLRGNDAVYQEPAWRSQRAFAFNGNVTELTVSGIWQRAYSRKLRPYLLAGAGLALTRINRDYSSFNTDYFSAEPDVIQGLEEDKARQTPRAIIIFPVGVGAQYRFLPRWSVTAEGALRLMRTDYLDGFSRAANPQLADYYSRIAIGVSYNMGGVNRLNCPR